MSTIKEALTKIQRGAKLPGAVELIAIDSSGNRIHGKTHVEPIDLDALVKNPRLANMRIAEFNARVSRCVGNQTGSIEMRLLGQPVDGRTAIKSLR